jgi:hypothetical protein
MSMSALWRGDIDALAFRPDGRPEFCMVHRRAFRTLMGANPTPEDCEAFFRGHRGAFEAAAHAKIAEKDIARGTNFHLTSRDIARRLALANRARLG